jgi:hypothetical protein
MTALLLLGEQELPVYCEFEYALRSGDKGECLNNMLVITEYVICRTGSALPVVSRHTVFEGYVILLVHFLPTSLFLNF